MFLEFCVRVTYVKGAVTMVMTDSEAVYGHGAFAIYCQDQGIRVSPTYLKEMNGQAERGTLELS